jgi:Flp pilus assembly pilin Flp
MINKINEKVLELRNRLQDLKDERGQTSAEYVAVTAVAVAIAIGIVYTTLQGALDDAINAIGTGLTDFVNDEIGPDDA